MEMRRLGDGMLEGVGQSFEAGLDAAVPNVVTDADFDTTEKLGIGVVGEGKPTTILFVEVFLNTATAYGVELRGAFDKCLTAFFVEANEIEQGVHNRAIIAGLSLGNLFESFADLVLVEASFRRTEAIDPTGGAGCILGNFHSEWLVIGEGGSG